eukprot:SAG31_NODE_43116_length_268_cov_0.917160_1_plen_51_part_01
MRYHKYPETDIYAEEINTCSLTSTCDCDQYETMEGGQTCVYEKGRALCFGA